MGSMNGRSTFGKMNKKTSASPRESQQAISSLIEKIKAKSAVQSMEQKFRLIGSRIAQSIIDPMSEHPLELPQAEVRTPEQHH
jgi:hypothetical protein